MSMKNELFFYFIEPLFFYPLLTFLIFYFDQAVFPHGPHGGELLVVVAQALTTVARMPAFSTGFRYLELQSVDRMRNRVATYA